MPLPHFINHRRYNDSAPVNDCPAIRVVSNVSRYNDNAGYMFVTWLKDTRNNIIADQIAIMKTGFTKRGIEILEKQIKDPKDNFFMIVAVQTFNLPYYDVIPIKKKVYRPFQKIDIKKYIM